MIAWLLDWAAGILMGILVLAVLGGPSAALGLEWRVQVWGGAAAWCFGAGLGVWLCMGRPLQGRGLAAAVAACVLGVGLVSAPARAELGSALVVHLAGIIALISAPVWPRLVLARLRPPPA